jgi:uncharacterized protein YkwD
LVTSVALFIAGCAGASATAVGDGERAAAVQTSAISPSGRPATLYRTAVPVRPSTDPFAALLKGELDRHLKRPGRGALVEDARLDLVAYDVARITAEKKVPTSSIITFLLGYYGVVEPEPNLIEMKGSRGAENAAARDLGRQIAEIATASTWRQVGIGIWRSGDAWSAVLALQEDSLKMEPLPRALPSGGQIDLSVRLGGAYHSPEVLVTPPKGAVKRLPLQPRAASFGTRLSCAFGDGVYQVEVAAEDRRGSTVLANFPVYCGIAPPDSLRVTATTVTSASNPEAVEKQILDLVDRDRADSGLPPLQRDPRLARVARAYSREMAETGEVAHVSQRTGNAVDRVRAAGIAPMPTVIAENVGRDYSADGIERALMASPGHRDNILSGAVTHVGVGVAVGKQEGNAIPIFVTQVFAGWGQ